MGIVAGRSTQSLECMRTVVAAFITTAFVANAAAMSERPLPELPKNAHDTEAVLTKRIPSGTPLARAQREMETLGFKCAPGTGTFVGGVTGPYLYCDRLSRAIVAERYQAALVHAAGKVTSIHATYGLIGP